MVAQLLEFLLSVKLRLPLLEVRQKCPDSFPDEAAKWTLLSRWGAKTGALLELWREPRCSPWVETGMSGSFLSLPQGNQGLFRGSRGNLGFLSRHNRVKGPQSRGGENLLVFLELQQKIWGSSLVMMGTSGTSLCGLRKVQSSCELWGASRDSSAIVAEAEVLIWRWGRNLTFPLQYWHESRGSTGVSTGDSGLVSCGDMHFRFPLELEKKCQTSCSTGFFFRDLSPKYQNIFRSLSLNQI